MSKIEYIIENKRYSIEYIKNLGITEEDIDQLIMDRVCNRFIDSSLLNFNFVGIISNRDSVVSVLPKYCNEEDDDIVKKKETIQIIKVLKKYALNVTIDTGDLNYLSHNVNGTFVSELALADYIIKDYISYGIYAKNHDEIMLNESGEIYWEDTIDLINPYMSRNKVYYSDTYNIVNLNDPYEYITRIHKWAIMLCLDRYSEVLGYSATISADYNENIEHLGNTEVILSLLQNEIQNVYSDRKIGLLKALFMLISMKYTWTNKVYTLFGKTKFEQVWEDVCSEVMDNDYYNYKQYIPKPKWKNSEAEFYSIKTLEPDILRSINYNGTNMFFIMDAKYYDIEFIKGKLNNAPGVSDIIKQIFYEQALKEFIKDHRIVNIFLFPKQLKGSFEEVIGKVSLEISNSNPIILIYINAQKAYDMYINSQTVSSEYLFKLVNYNLNDVYEI